MRHKQRFLMKRKKTQTNIFLMKRQDKKILFQVVGLVLILTDSLEIYNPRREINNLVMSMLSVAILRAYDLSLFCIGFGTGYEEICKVDMDDAPHDCGSI